MKKTILLLMLCSLSWLSVMAQVDQEGENPNKSSEDDVFTVVETMPEFPGGEKAMNKFLDENLVYPTSCKKKGIEGKVWVGFIVQKDGRITNVEILRGAAPDLDAEALRVIKLMPNWIPGKQSGADVIVKFRFPINFVLR